MIYLNLLFAFFLCAWILKPFHHAYYVGENLVDIVRYQYRNVFHIPLIKIYRTKKYTDDDMDIFGLIEIDRFKKVVKYKLIAINEEDRRIIAKHQE